MQTDRVYLALIVNAIVVVASGPAHATHTRIFTYAFVAGDAFGSTTAYNSIWVRAGASMKLVVYIKNTHVGVSEYMVVLDSATGGNAGEVTYVPGTALIDQQRFNWIYAGTPEPCGLAGCQVDQGPPARFGGPGNAPPVTAARYLGELMYAVSPDASGTFEINFVDPGLTGGTVLIGPNDEPIVFTPQPVVLHVFTPNEVCFLPPDGGPCDGDCPRYYYDAVSDECQPFLYGCCGGNLNNFETLQGCEAFCLSVGAIPTLSAWGMLALCLLVVTAGTLVLRRSLPG